MTDLDQLLASVAERIQPQEDALERVVRTAGRRQRNRRVGAWVAAMAAFAGMLVAGWVVVGSLRPSAPVDEPTSSVPSSPLVRGLPCDGGTWSASCPEAQWLHPTLHTAGLTVREDLGDALLIRPGQTDVLIWATSSPTRSLPDLLSRGDFDLFAEVKGVRAFSDGARIVWEVQGLQVWVERVGSPLPDPEALTPLIAATARVQFTPPSCCSDEHGDAR